MDSIVDESATGSIVLGDTKGGLGFGLAQLMDELAYGVLVTSLEGQLLHANQAARHELGRRRLLASRDNLLHACAPDDAKILQEALAKVGEGKRSLITLGPKSAASLTLAVIPLKAETAAHLPPRAAWVFARASVCESLMLCFFARSHALTTTEEHVLGILCQGYSAPEIAAQMKVAVSTVRSHVRSLCAKTRSSGVRELVNRVAVLPPVAPTLRHELMH
ncbi:MAG: helix-turn-helix transcriptional regulator [Burkholderiales bacterium]|nr:helix-turn-helix transcriptional regulator [Burkholderiales bacterium]